MKRCEFHACLLDLNDLVLCDNPLIQPITILGGAFLGRVINVDDSKTLLVGNCPFKIIQNRPVEVAADVSPIRDGPAQLSQVAAQIIHALGIVDLAIQRDRVDVCHPIFSDHDRGLISLPQEARSPIQRFG